RPSRSRSSVPRPWWSTSSPSAAVAAGRSRYTSESAIGLVRRRGGGFVEVIADEVVEIAVENALGVTRLVAGAMVLDPLVGVQEVAADLRAPGDVLDLAALLGQLLRAFALLQLDQLRAQELHRHRLVLGLRALVLALHDDAGGDVGDAHGRVGLVDVLAAGAGGAVGVDAQVGVVDLDLDTLVDQRADV